MASRRTRTNAASRYLPAGSKAMRHAGSTYGRWRIVRVLGYRERGTLTVLAECACGNRRVRPIRDLANGKSTQCRSCANRLRVERRRERVERDSAGRGRPVVGWSGSTPLFACPCCGRPSARGRCHKLALSDLRWRPKTYPQSISLVADRFAVSRQRVSQVIQERGWEGMLAYFRSRPRKRPA